MGEESKTNKAPLTGREQSVDRIDRAVEDKKNAIVYGAVFICQVPDLFGFSVQRAGHGLFGHTGFDRRICDGSRFGRFNSAD